MREHEQVAFLKKTSQVDPDLEKEFRLATVKPSLKKSF